MVSRIPNIGHRGSSDQPGRVDETSELGSSPLTTYVPFLNPLQVDGGEDVEAQTQSRPNPSSAKIPDSDRTKNYDGHERKSMRYHLRMFWLMSLPYFRESQEARCLFAGLIILMLLDSAARIAFSYLARDFWSALGDKDAEQFYTVMKTFLVALCLLAPVNVFYRFQRQRLAIRWRLWMTERILELYFYSPHRIYYRLEQSGGAAQMGTMEVVENRSVRGESTTFVDNPDQRLAEDVRSFTQYSLSIFLTVAISIIDLTAFSVVLYTIEPKLFVSIVCFATFGTLATFVLGKDLVRLNFQRLSREADFRYSLVRLRENAESIAFFRGEVTEGKEVRRRFDSLVANLYAVIGTQRNLEFFTVSYNYLTWILPVVVIAPQYMEGLVELGVVQQAAAAFGHVLDDLSLIINEFEGLSEFSASIGRLHQFLKAIQDSDPDRGEISPLMGRPANDSAGAKAQGINDGIFKDPIRAAATALRSDPIHSSLSKQYSANNTTGENIYLRELPPVSDNSGHVGLALNIHNLCLSTPNILSDSAAPRQNRCLISNLDLQLKWGQKLLIIGPSGIGKSSLLRAIAGLWKSGSGVIERANISDVYFLPQKPYCPLGTLRDQLLYPFNSSSSDAANDGTMDQSHQKPDDSMLLDILIQVDLHDLAKRSGDGLDTVLDWGNVLSLGEQQRLAFGRILVHKPRLVILDEATSAMDVTAEGKMYTLLSNSTCVSVGHRPTLLKYHDTRLKLYKEKKSNHDTDLAGYSRGNYEIGKILSTAEGVSSEEIDLFFR